MVCGEGQSKYAGLLPGACGHLSKEQIHLLLPNQTCISTWCRSGNGAGLSVSLDIPMGLSSGVSPAAWNHPVLIRKENSEADLSVVLCGAFLPVSHILVFFTGSHALRSMTYL